MTDTSTTHPLSASTDSGLHQPESASAEADGHGRHRGPVTDRDGESTPHGRHRRPSGGTGGTAV
ncbi:hypothetical protein [Streptomyces sp. BV129]|uniref:hypothetical protein n=1 Tax=Streptomyces sp. BV129 TaxID=2849671 RepID=UPI001C2EB258|nr:MULTISPECIES: hypothetical protein [Streptomyces]MBV1947517.1 hypothetical protein [Streptomyces sp. BV129]